MKLWKAWKSLKVLEAAQEEDQPGPSGPSGARGPAPHGGMMQMFQRMGQFAAGSFEVVAPNRGAPLPGTAPNAVEPGDADALAAGIGTLKQRDPAFDPDGFVQFANQVFAAVCRSFSTADPTISRPVLADRLWEPMAEVGGGPMARMTQMFGMLSASGALVGMHTDPLYDTAIVRFTVQVPPEMGANMPPWPEDWTFQRSLVVGGNPMALAEQCPGCGSAAKVDVAGNCQFCHQAIPVRTIGWLATTVHSHNPMMEQQTQAMIEAMRANPDQLEMAPDFMLRQIPPETLAEIAPDIAARLKAEGRLG